MWTHESRVSGEVLKDWQMPVIWRSVCAPVEDWCGGIEHAQSRSSSEHCTPEVDVVMQVCQHCGRPLIDLADAVAAQKRTISERPEGNECSSMALSEVMRCQRQRGGASREAVTMAGYSFEHPRMEPRDREKD